MDFDLLIRGGTVVDGSGSPPVAADVGVRGDRIVAVGALPDAAAAEVVDATDRVVCPGFIDVHVHSETALRGNGEIWGSVSQGVTTHLTAPDGFGWAPLAPDQSADLWRSTAFAYGQPDLRPEWPTIESYLGGLRRRHADQRRPDGAAPGDPLRGPRLGRAPARCGRHRPDVATSPASGWRPARSVSTPASTTSPPRTARPMS